MDLSSWSIIEMLLLYLSRTVIHKTERWYINSLWLSVQYESGWAVLLLAEISTLFVDWFGLGNIVLTLFVAVILLHVSLGNTASELFIDTHRLAKNCSVSLYAGTSVFLKLSCQLCPIYLLLLWLTMHPTDLQAIQVFSVPRHVWKHSSAVFVVL